MSKTNPIPAVARRASRESDPTKLVETLMDLLLTRPNQLTELVRDVIVKGPERGTEARPGSPRQHRRAG